MNENPLVVPATADAARRSGALFYFTGKPCKHKHIAERYTSTHGCVECLRRKTYQRICWDNMMARCYNPKHDLYRRCGGRGIKVCERWLDYENFVVDIGERPAPHTEFRRRDIDGDYTPENCRWTGERPPRHRLDFNGEIVSQAEACRRLDITTRGFQRMSDIHFGGKRQATLEHYLANDKRKHLRRRVCTNRDGAVSGGK